MRIDIGTYDNNRAGIQKWFKEQTFFEPAMAASVMAASTHVPVIVVCFYIGEINGWSQDILDNIENLIKSYKYTKIIGVPESYPGRRL